MKKFLTLFSLLLFATTIFAQRGKVSLALSYKESGDLQKAYSTIQDAIDSTNEKSEKSITWPRTWEVRGQILQEIYKKNVKDIVEEPLFEAFNSLMTAVKYDEDSKLSKSLIIDFTFLQTDLSNYAISCYESQRFAQALTCFENYMAISALPIMKQKGKENDQEVVDTAIVYNAGLAAFKAEDWKKSINYFTKSAHYGYNGPSSYHFVFQAYQELGDTLQALKTLKEAFENYPNDETTLVELINFYINKGKSDDAIKYIDLAISEKPNNATLFTAKGAMLEKMGDVNGAIEMYKKSITVDSTQFTPYYNLSVIYYNRGVEVVNNASKIPPSQAEKYDAEMEKAKEHFRLSLPYIEKAYELDSTEMAILESLKTVYYRLQMNEKYLDVSKKIQSMKQ